MADDEFELREVRLEAGEAGDRLQESVVGDVAAVVAACAGTGGVVLGWAQYSLGRSERDRDDVVRQAELAALDAESCYWQARLELEVQQQRAELGYINLGVDDDGLFYGLDADDY